MKEKRKKNSAAPTLYDIAEVITQANNALAKEIRKETRGYIEEMRRETREYIEAQAKEIRKETREYIEEIRKETNQLRKDTAEAFGITNARLDKLEN